jgi:hypothetical protein
MGCDRGKSVQLWGKLTVLAACAGKPTVLAAWARYEEEDIPDRSGPVLIGQCEVTFVVHQKVVYGNPDPARCLNLGLGKREFANAGTQMRNTFFNITFQTFGFHGAAIISTRGW